MNPERVKVFLQELQEFIVERMEQVDGKTEESILHIA